MAFGDFVQTDDNFASGSGTALAIAAFNAALGNLLVVATVYDASAERTVTVSDSVDGAYTQAVAFHNDADNQGVAIHYLVVATGGSRTITQTLSAAGTFRHIAANEYEGPVNASPLDKTDANMDDTNNPEVGPVTPDTNGQLIVAVIGNPNGVAYAAAGGFTERNEWGDTAQVQDLVQATAAAISAQWTANAADHAGALATFRPAAGGGTQFEETPADTVALSEAVTKRAGKTLAEALAASETLTPQARKAILESVALTEQLVRQLARPLGETVQLSEDLQAVKLVARALADTVTLTEHLTRVVQKAGGLAESLGLAEALAAQTGRSVAETLALSENLTAVKVAVQDVGDVLALSETVSRLTARVLEEQVALTEAQHRETRKVLGELVGFTEQLVATLLREAAVGDSVSLTETQQVQVGKAVQEALGLTETRFVQIARTIGEQILLAEVLDALLIPEGGFVVVLVRFGKETFQVPAFRRETFQVPAFGQETFAVPAFRRETFQVPAFGQETFAVPAFRRETFQGGG